MLSTDGSDEKGRQKDDPIVLDVVSFVTLGACLLCLVALIDSFLVFRVEWPRAGFLERPVTAATVARAVAFPFAAAVITLVAGAIAFGRRNPKGRTRIGSIAAVLVALGTALIAAVEWRALSGAA